MIVVNYKEHEEFFLKILETATPDNYELLLAEAGKQLKNRLSDIEFGAMCFVIFSGAKPVTEDEMEEHIAESVMLERGDKEIH